MNRKIEKQYIRKVRQSLPVYGCKERAYIKKLEEHLQDYCDEYPDVAEEDIVKEFGTPTSVVSDYFCEIDEDYLFRKLRIRNHVSTIKNIRQLEIQILQKKKRLPS